MRITPPATAAERIADLSDVQVLRVRLIREGYAGGHENKQLTALECWVASRQVTIEEFDAEVQRRFGSWPKPLKEGDRTVWYRHEFTDMASTLAAWIKGHSKTVIRPDPVRARRMVSRTDLRKNYWDIF